MRFSIASARLASLPGRRRLGRPAMRRTGRGAAAPEWFVPGQGQQRPAGQPQQRPAQQQGQQQRPAPRPSTTTQAPTPLPPGQQPPAAVIGIVDVPEIQRVSTAFTQVRDEIERRRQRLNDDLQREQNNWREQQQQLANQRASMPADQLRERERALQDRITDSQRIFRERSRTIEQAAQQGAGRDRADPWRGHPPGVGEPQREPGAATTAGHLQRPALRSDRGSGDAVQQGAEERQHAPRGDWHRGARRGQCAGSSGGAAGRPHRPRRASRSSGAEQAGGAVADPRFFAVASPQRLADIAAVAGASFEGDGERRFSGVAPLQTAGPEDVSFLDNRRYAPLLAGTKAGAVVLLKAFADQVPEGTIALVAAQPYLGFARVATLLHPPVSRSPASIPARWWRRMRLWARGRRSAPASSSAPGRGSASAASSTRM